MTQNTKLEELEQLRARVQQLEAELGVEASQAETPEWPPRGFYGIYAATSGAVLGMIGAMVSLLFNVIGSVIVDQNPLRLIQVYLTFPLGEPALEMEGGLAVAIGCCLYLLTGMVVGIPFQWILSRWFDETGLIVRFIVVTVLALVLWLVNFYVLIAALQPLLIGGNWILEQIPPWVAAATHLVFGWSMLAVQPLGRFVASRSSSLEVP